MHRKTSSRPHTWPATGLLLHPGLKAMAGDLPTTPNPHGDGSSGGRGRWFFAEGNKTKSGACVGFRERDPAVYHQMVMVQIHYGERHQRHSM